MNERLAAQIRGCLLAGAAGDALGAPIEFATWEEIAGTFGPEGATEILPPGRFTDDTQMTLFTCEGLLVAGALMEQTGVCFPPGQLHDAYLRWLATQGSANANPDENASGGAQGWLAHVEILQRRQAPGSTCLSALESGAMGRVNAPINGSKGSGGVMRSAPAGFLVPGVPPGASPAESYELGCEIAAVTHGHPDGIHAAGALGAVICSILAGADIHAAVIGCLELTTTHMAAVLRHALDVGADRAPSPQTIAAELGGGWVGDEALGIAVACAVGAESLRDGVVASVNHSGDSDSTGALCGNLLGVLHGLDAIPVGWLDALDGRGLVEEVAEDSIAWLDWSSDGSAAGELGPIWMERYASGL